MALHSSLILAVLLIGVLNFGANLLVCLFFFVAGLREFMVRLEESSEQLHSFHCCPRDGEVQ